MNRKALFTERKRLQEEIAASKALREQSLLKDKKAKSEIANINRLLNTNATGEIVVTDHAKVRYMQRVKNLDMDDLKASIVPENTRKLIEKYNTGKFPAGDHFVVVKNRFIMTVLSNDPTKNVE